MKPLLEIYKLKMSVNKIIRPAAIVFVASLNSGCASQSELSEVEIEVAPVEIDRSYLDVKAEGGDQGEILENTSDILGEEGEKLEDLSAVPLQRPLKPLPRSSRSSSHSVMPGDVFVNKENLSVVAEDMPLKDFLHYVFGDLLEVNYIFGDKLGASVEEGTVTLNLTQQLSRRQLFDLVRDLLLKRGIYVKYGSDTFYIYELSPSDSVSDMVVSVGGNPSDVPDTTQKILQIIPLEYGVKLSIDQSLKSILKANRIYSDAGYSSLFIEGSREEILQAMDIISILDVPATRGKHIGLISLTFVSPQDFSEQAKSLLENEGVPTAINAAQQKNVVLVPIENLSAVVVFAVSESLLDRVRYWALLTDVPSEEATQNYYIYRPTYARALDLGDSIATLLGGSASAGSRSGGVRQGEGANSTGNAPSSDRGSGFQNESMRMVVDERTNALIFFTSGSEYKSILPLLSDLDILPRQVMLDMTIAEVTLKDEFKFGVEWALQNSEVRATTQGAFGVSDMGGLGLLIDGAKGPLQANFFQTNSLVNILSNPTIMVRDGVSAQIQVGSDISVVGQTTQDPINGDRQTTQSSYRQTGITLSVKPTVNARGIIVLEIDQTISNSVPDSTGAGGNPDIFERKLKTEVLAKSGQTIMLAGLVSEGVTAGGSGAPGLRKIPIIGNLFKASAETANRTELIMLITPRVMETADQWDDVYREFKSSLRFFSLD